MPLLVALAVGFALGSHYRIGRRLDRLTGVFIEYLARREPLEGQPAAEAKEDLT